MFSPEVEIATSSIGEELQLTELDGEIWLEHSEVASTDTKGDTVASYVIGKTL